MAIARHKTRQRELREGRALSRRAQRGDRRAFELLYASYESRLYRFCHRLTGSEVAAAALVEATFARALANLPGARRPDRRRRSPVRHRARAGVSSNTNGGPPRAAAGGGEHIREVGAANRRLAPRQRMVLALRDLEGRSDEEIARTLGTDLPTVAALVARARLRLRAELRLPAASRAAPPFCPLCPPTPTARCRSTSARSSRRTWPGARTAGPRCSRSRKPRCAIARCPSRALPASSARA